MCNGHYPTEKCPLAKANPFILVWESLTGITSVPLPGSFVSGGLDLNLIQAHFTLKGAQFSGF
jgi:hypothetical protein